MRVTLAKRQPTRAGRIRAAESCDDCLGRAIMRCRDLYGRDPVLPNNELVPPDGTERVYNVFIPGIGTSQFTLHPGCAESLRNDTD